MRRKARIVRMAVDLTLILGGVAIVGGLSTAAILSLRQGSGYAFGTACVVVAGVFPLLDYALQRLCVADEWAESVLRED